MTRDITGSRRWLFLLGISSGLSSFGMASVVPALPILADALSADYSQLQFLVSAYLLGLGVAQPVQGLLCDRFGRRPVMLIGFVAFAFASIAASLTTSLALLIGARFLQALGVSVGTVAARAIVRDTHDAERAAVALSIITAIMGIAPIVAPIVGGAAAGVWGWRSIFLLHSVVAVMLVIAISLYIRETRPVVTAETSMGGLLRAAGELVRDRGFLGYTMIYGFSNGASFSFLTIGAALFATMFEVGAAQFGLLWAVLVITYAFGAAGSGFMSRRYGSAAMLRVGLSLNLVGGALFVLAALLPTPMLWLFMTALSIFTAANGITTPLALAGAVSERPNLAGVAAGLSSAIAMLTSMVFSALTGVLYVGDALAPALLLGAGAVLTAVSARAIPTPLGRKR